MIPVVLIWSVFFSFLFFIFLTRRAGVVSNFELKFLYSVILMLNKYQLVNSIRHHYVSKLKAIDTAELEHAQVKVESLKKEYRQLELEHAQLKVIQKKKIRKMC